jgi:hypothetical protein
MLFPNIPIWVLNNVWPPISLRKLAFNRVNRLCSSGFLNLLRELLRKHADQMPPHPITITIKPGDLFLLKDLLPYPLGLQWTSPHLIIPTTPTAVKLNGFPQWWHLSRNN